MDVEDALHPVVAVFGFLEELNIFFQAQLLDLFAQAAGDFVPHQAANARVQHAGRGINTRRARVPSTVSAVVVRRCEVIRQLPGPA